MSVKSKKSGKSWRHHKDRWKNCQECELCETRKNIVLYRGKLPCDVLFIGEAPGRSEDVLGSPFKGPAGHLLDRTIQQASLDEYRLGFTNLIGCLPLDPHTNKKVNQPHKDHIKACSPRLQDIYEVAQPAHLVYVGKLSEKWGPKYLHRTVEDGDDFRMVHPAAILRADPVRRTTAQQMNLVTLVGLKELLDEEA